jgi:TP901 family phage tail tape measure protein
MAELPKAGIMLVAEGITQWLNQINTANTAMTNFATSTTNAANQVNSIPTTGIDNTGKAIDNLANHAAQAQAKAGVFQEVWTGALRQVGGFATQKMMEAGGAVLKFFTDAPKLAGEFDAKFNNILAVGGEEVAKNQDQIKKLIISVGKDLPISTNEAADAYAELITGGFDPATLALGTYTNSIQFALGSNLGLAEAANILAKQTGAFTDPADSAATKAKFAADAMDIMTQAANSSSVKVAELATGLLNAGGTANAVGMDYKDFVTTMAAIAPAFNSSSEAGTGFKNFLIRLNPSTKAAQEAMQKLGLFSMDTSKMMTFLQEQGIKPLGTDVGTLTEQVSKYLKESQGLSKAEIAKTIVSDFGSSKFYDATGNLKKMSEVADILGESMKGLSNEQKIQAMQQIFGNDGMNAAVMLSKLGAAGMDEMSAKMEKANGVQKQYDTAMKGAQMAQTNFNGTLEALQITMGTYVLPYMEQFFNYLNMVASAALGLFNNKKTLADIIPPGVMEAIQPLIGAFDDVKKEGLAMWDDLSTIFDDIQNILGITGTSGGDALVKGFKFIFEVIRLTLLATMRIISDTIKGIKVLLESPGIEFAIVTLTTAFQVMEEVIMGIMETLVAVFNGDFGKIPAILNTHMEAITKIFDGFDHYFYLMWGQLVTYLGGIWDNIYNTIMGQLELIIVGIGGWIMGVEKSIVDGWNAVVAGVMYVLNHFWELVAAYWLNFAFNLGKALRLIYDLVLLSFQLTWDGVVWIFNNAIPLINKALINMGNGLEKWLNETGDSISKAFADGWRDVVKMWENAWPDTQRALSKFGVSFTGWISRTWDDAKASFESLWDSKTIGEKVGDGILEGLKANASVIFEYVSNLAKGIWAEFLKGLGTKTTTPAPAPAPAPTTPAPAQSIMNDKVDAITKSLGATATAAAFGAARAMVNNTYNYSNATAYNLGVNTTATAGDTIQSFAIMGALAS